MTEHRATLADPQIQATLLAEAMAEAEVGIVVWDDDRHYVAANQKACELIGCTLDELLGSVVGHRAVDGDAVVEGALSRAFTRGRVTIRRDGGDVELEHVTFPTRTAGLPHIASLIWEASATAPDST